MELEKLTRVACALAERHRTEDVLNAVVEGLCEDTRIALARIWLVRPGDRCDVCAYAPSCPSMERCLHLVASDGASVAAPTERWRNLDGRYRRFPITMKRIGRLVATGEPINEKRDETSRVEFLEPEWAAREGIVAFSGQPLIFGGEIVGAICVFSRAPMSAEDMDLLRILANHAAASIAHARAFETISALSDRLARENAYLREAATVGADGHALLGESRAMHNVRQQIAIAASADVPVLIAGESGTGKELVAQAIHEGSVRRQRAMVRVNCASVPEGLFESEFFGHAKGAFTGALRERTGRFRVADGSTLFLDEVSEIPLASQAKLLRVLQEGTLEAVGDDRTHRVDVRILAATNRELTERVAGGEFREDLFYRINVLPIHVPPLRERKDDIGLLAKHFATKAAQRYGFAPPTIASRHIAVLQAYPWPGNIRELHNVVERSVLLSRDGEFNVDLAQGLSPIPNYEKQSGVSAGNQPCETYTDLDAIERDMVRQALERSRGKVSGRDGAARALGMKPTTLAYRVRKLGLSGFVREITDARRSAS